MEAPEKLYLEDDEKLFDLFPVLCLASTEKHGNEVEYIRKDAFIKKAISWIDYNNRNGGCNFDGWEKDFKNYMKGENE